MIHSMTGFGDAQLEEAGQAYHLEIRSVNNRYFKASIHLPDEFGYLESEVESLLRRRITRGSLTVRVHVRDLSAEAAQQINAAAIQRYVSQLRDAAGHDPRLASEQRIMIDLATLATLPGVCQPRKLTEQEREHFWSIVSKLLDAAFQKLIAMRESEGRLLAADLTTHAQRILTHLESVRERAPLVVEDFRRRLTSRIAELLAKSNVTLAADDLLREVAVYAERSDVSEEISRLFGHLKQFDECVASDEPAGRKLDFLAQEMLREANTIGSKGSDGEIARHIIEIKSAIDRLKEQVQNVE